MDLYYLLPPLIAVCIGAILVVALLIRQRSFAHRILLLLVLATTAWAVIIFGMRKSPDTEHALMWDKFVIPVCVAMAVFYYHFSLVLVKIQRQRGLLVTDDRITRSDLF